MSAHVHMSVSLYARLGPARAGHDVPEDKLQGSRQKTKASVQAHVNFKIGDVDTWGCRSDFCTQTGAWSPEPSSIIFPCVDNCDSSIDSGPQQAQ